jgi:hypothetical protein
MINKHYRIGIIDDFRNTHSYLENNIFGTLSIVNCSITKGELKKYQESSDSIALFINFEKVLDTKSRQEAVQGLLSIINDIPPNFRENLAQFTKDLIKSIS